MKTNVFIADDHQMVIDGLSLLLSSNEHYKVIGSATNGDHALEQIVKLKPHIALLDLRMPGKDGLQLTRHIHDNNLPTRSIIISMHGDKRYITDARNYGASGYLLKNAGMNELFIALDEVCNGKTYFVTPNVQGEMSSLSILTSRETEILTLIINQHTTLEIAGKLQLSHFTIETHRKNILRKTGVKNLAGLVKFAVDNKIEF